MDVQGLYMPHHHQVIMNRFVEASKADERVVAAFISGSYARGTTDIYSDLDFGLTITDEAYDDFFTGREAFIRLLGEPVFLEDYNGDGADFVFSIFSDGTEVELGFGRESHFNHIYVGSYRVLLDKKGILAAAVFSWQEPTQAEQIETLRRLQTLPVEQLAPLQASFCLMERDAMLQAALTIVRFYQELAPPLAQAHGIPYPADLARVMSGRLELLSNEVRRGPS